MKIINQVHAIAKATPAEKLLMVQCLKTKGEEVAINSSCTRDLPSLIEADVGIFSAHNNIAEMAKEDADIIITRPRNSGEIAKFIKFGRYVCQSVAKLLEVHLILNLCAFTMNLIFEVWKSEAQLSSAQLLWANLVVEGIGAIVLAVMLETDSSNHADKDRGNISPPAKWSNYNQENVGKCSPEYFIPSHNLNGSSDQRARFGAYGW